MKHEEQQQQKVVKGSTTCRQSDSGGACGVVSLPIGMPPGGAAGSALCCVAEPLKRDEWSHLTALYAPKKKCSNGFSVKNALNMKMPYNLKKKTL